MLSNAYARNVDSARRSSAASLSSGKIARRLSAIAARHVRISFQAIQVPTVPIAYDTARGSSRTR